MQFDPDALKPTDLYHLLIGIIAPRPIAWVGTVSPRGIPNLAPFSYFTGAGVLPPMVCFVPINRRDGSPKDTILNLRSTPEFTISVVPEKLAEQMSATSAELDYEQNEFAASGITASPSVKIKPPGVADSPVIMECALHQIVELGGGPLSGNLVVGRILLIHVNQSCIGDDGQIDEVKLDLIGRMGGNAYSRTSDRFEIVRPQKP